MRGVPTINDLRVSRAAIRLGVWYLMDHAGQALFHLPG